MQTTYTNHEDMQEPPKRQTATSIFKMFVGSLPASLLLAIVITWLLYKVLGERVGDIYAPQVWGACLGTGGVSTAAAAVGLVTRSLNITNRKMGNSVVQDTTARDVPSPSSFEGEEETISFDGDDYDADAEALQARTVIEQEEHFANR